ncbi:contactin-5-like, partial [Mobula birostris]|uniref:contactin-5-like n=1 Tax=Mobula birostris TaxID=1983395 RepID=UPI003B285EF7
MGDKELMGKLTAMFGLQLQITGSYPMGDMLLFLVCLGTGFFTGFRSRRDERKDVCGGRADYRMAETGIRGSECRRQSSGENHACENSCACLRQNFRGVLVKEVSSRSSCTGIGDSAPRLRSASLSSRNAITRSRVTPPVAVNDSRITEDHIGGLFERPGPTREDKSRTERLRCRDGESGSANRRDALRGESAAGRLSNSSSLTVEDQNEPGKPPSMATSWKLLLLMSVTSILTGRSQPRAEHDLEERGPEFVHEPQELTIAAGEEAKRVSLRCQARGSPRPLYRWFHNGSLLQTEGSPRYGLDGGSLVIHAPSMLLDSGTFQCLASNSVGSVLSREAGLHFAYLSNFSDHQRGPVSVREGQGVVLMCSAPSHTTEVVYSWVYGALPRSVEEDSRRFVSQVTGNLYVAKATPADVGRYICQLKDGQSGRRVLSPPTSLTLRKDGVMGEYEPKMEVHFPSVVQVLQGTTAALECFALGNPVPTISWRRTSGDLPSRARLRKSRAVLEILNVEAGDAGTYECRAENSRGESVVRGVLLVHSRPQWTRPLNDTTLDSGQDLRWECRASGRPQPGYRWLKNGENLLSQNRAVVRNGLLTIARVNRSDAGMYQCVAENRHGKLYSNAELRILASAPSFELHPLPREIVVCVGQELVIECKPQSSPKAALSWRKGTRPLANA